MDRGIGTIMALLCMISVLACTSDYGIESVGPKINAYFIPSPSGPVTLQNGSVDGDIIEVDVKIGKVNNVFGTSIKIAYDAKKLKWTGSYRKGRFLEKNGSVPIYRVALDGDSGEGRLIIGASLVSPALPVSGSGTVITIPFRVIARGKSTLSIYDSILADPSADRIVTVSGGEGAIIAAY